MTQPQTSTSVILPAATILVTVAIGLLNRAQARRGPTGSVSWTLDHVEKSRFEPRNTGTTDAFKVKVEAESSVRLDGEQEFERFAPGQRASYLIPRMFGMSDPHMRVTWEGPARRWKRKPKRQEWATELP